MMYEDFVNRVTVESNQQLEAWKDREKRLTEILSNRDRALLWRVCVAMFCSSLLGSMVCILFLRLVLG